MHLTAVYPWHDEASRAAYYTFMAEANSMSVAEAEARLAPVFPANRTPTGKLRTETPDMGETPDNSGQVCAMPGCALPALPRAGSRGPVGCSDAHRKQAARERHQAARTG